MQGEIGQEAGGGGVECEEHDTTARKNKENGARMDWSSPNKSCIPHPIGNLKQVSCKHGRRDWRLCRRELAPRGWTTKFCRGAGPALVKLLLLLLEINNNYHAPKGTTCSRELLTSATKPRLALLKGKEMVDFRQYHQYMIMSLVQ